MNDKHATYIGPIEHLKGKGALVRPDLSSHRCVVAQFDDVTLRRSGVGVSMALPLPDDALGFGWHVFPADDFKLDEDQS